MTRIMILLMGACYALSPYDLLPDFLVGLGWLDDLIILGLLWKYVYSPMRKRYQYARAYQQGRRFSDNNDREGFSEKRASGSGYRPGAEKRLKDPWNILGIGRNASLDEIKSAYRKLALKYHPDRIAHMGEDFRVLAEERFKEIQKAYQELKPR